MQLITKNAKVSLHRSIILLYLLFNFCYIMFRLIIGLRKIIVLQKQHFLESFRVPCFSCKVLITRFFYRTTSQRCSVQKSGFRGFESTNEKGTWLALVSYIVLKNKGGVSRSQLVLQNGLYISTRIKTIIETFIFYQKLGHQRFLLIVRGITKSKTFLHAPITLRQLKCFA